MSFPQCCCFEFCNFLKWIIKAFSLLESNSFVTHVVDVFSSVVLHDVLFFCIVVLALNDYKCSLVLSSRTLMASLVKKTFQPGCILDIMFNPRR